MKTTTYRARRVLMGLLTMGWSLVAASASEATKSPATSEPLFQASLFEDVGGIAVKKGGTLAMLAGNDLHLTVFFAGLRHPWGQVDLYRGDPKDGGEHLQNLALTIPTPNTHGGGFAATVSLTESQVQDLNEGQLYLYVIMATGGLNDHLSGPIQALPTFERRVVETGLSEIWQGQALVRGRVLATLEDHQLRLVGFFAGLDAPWAQMDLYQGAVGAPGALVKNLLLNVGESQETGMGFDLALSLTEDEVQYLLSGSLSIAVQTFHSQVGLRGQLLAYPNHAPEVSEILAPHDGATLVIGGTGHDDALDPQATLATVSITPAGDLEGNQVAYFWQVSRSSDFSASPLITTALRVDSLTWRLTVGALAEVFDATWIGQPPPLHTPVTFYHRAITTDGALYSYGPAASVTLIRGTITANEPLDGVPQRFTLHNNYPNPFNPTTTIVFDLPVAAEVTLDVFNALGQRVLTNAPERRAAGHGQRIEVDAASLPSGLYVYRLAARTATGLLASTGRMTLLK